MGRTRRWAAGAFAIAFAAGFGVPVSAQRAATQPALPAVQPAPSTSATVPTPSPLRVAAVPAPASSATVGMAAGDALTPTLTVIEDDGVRIEETRLRGQPQRITVRSKVANARAYEIIVGAGGSDPSQDRGAAGRRAWSLFDF